MSLVLLLPVLGASVAHADPVVTIHHCSGTVGTANGPVIVHGYGPDEAQATTRAQRAGRQAAARMLGAASWGPMLMQKPEALGETLDALVVDEVIGLPGATWEAGSCDTIQLPTSLHITATVGETTLLQADPGLAASTARRLECEGAYAVPITQALFQVAAAPPEQRESLFQEAVDAAKDALTACYAAPASFSPVDRAVPPKVPKGPATCRASTGMLAKEPSGVGWGRDVEDALDAAGWDRSTNLTLHSLGAAHDAIAKASEETRATLVAKALSATLAVPTQATSERSLTACRTAPAGEATIIWMPRTIQGAQYAEDWPASPVAPSGAEAGGARDLACTSVLRSQLDQTNKAVPQAAPEMQGSLRSAGWAWVLMSRTECHLQSRTSQAGDELPVPGLEPYEEGALAAALDDAARRRDFAALCAVAPVFDDPRFAYELDKNPERFWSMVQELATMMGTGEAPRDFVTAEVGGRVLLLPARRR